jgi:hypothetical protein
MIIKLPNEIINIILNYKSEIDNDIIILQYNLITNKEYYKINFNSNLLWNIKSTLTMKKIYPIYFNLDNVTDNKILYIEGKKYYENLLRNKIKF